jgi:transcriptional regulator with XRE-family HTH domain
LENDDTTHDPPTAASAEFGARVRAARRLAGLTLDQLASRSGVSRPNLSKIERGERTPGLTAAVRVAEALGTTLSDLLDQRPVEPVQVTRGGSTVEYVDLRTRATREVLAHPTPGLEIVRYTLPPGSGAGPFPPHPPGTREVFVMLAGTLRIEAGPYRVELAGDDVATVPGDVEHRLVNTAEGSATRFVLVIGAAR